MVLKDKSQEYDKGLYDPGEGIVTHWTCPFSSRVNISILCGSTDNLTPREIEVCRSCGCFYSRSRDQATELGPYQSVHRDFETY
jgi:hypothetical protein